MTLRYGTLRFLFGLAVAVVLLPLTLIAAMACGALFLWDELELWAYFGGDDEWRDRFLQNENREILARESGI